MTNAAGRLAKLSNDLTAIQKLAVRAAADALTEALEKQAQRDTGGDGRMSGYGKKAATLAVAEKPIPDGVRLQPPGRGAYGQWLIVEAGANPHQVAGKHGKITGKGATAKRRDRASKLASGAKGAYSGAKPLRTPWGPRYRLTRPVSSPAKHTWTRGAAAGREAALDAVRAAFSRLIGG